MIRNIKLQLEYDGASFLGFQRQPGGLTVQESLESALTKLLNKKTKIQSASGRTDTGVHARGQIVNFKTESRLSCHAVQRGLNALLPKSVAVIKAEEASSDFHARYSAKSKIYEYRIWNSPVRSPLSGERAWHIPVKLNVAAMKKAARVFVGRHDFKSFTGARGTQKTTVRTIKKFTVSKQGHFVILRVEADGFLNHMVRNLTGSLVEVGKGRCPAALLEKILHSRDRKQAGPAAPGAGLTLLRVTYDSI